MSWLKRTFAHWRARCELIWFVPSDSGLANFALIGLAGIIVGSLLLLILVVPFEYQDLVARHRSKKATGTTGRIIGLLSDGGRYSQGRGILVKVSGGGYTTVMLPYGAHCRTGDAIMLDRWELASGPYYRLRPVGPTC